MCIHVQTFTIPVSQKYRLNRKHLKCEKQQQNKIAIIYNNKKIVIHSQVDRIYM